MQELEHGFELAKRVLTAPLFSLGGSQLTLALLSYLIATVILLFYLSGRLQSWMSGSALARTSLDIGARLAIASVTRYAILVLGMLIILQTAGINLTTLNVLAGAVGVGIGFGLQTIVGNFVCGLIIMFERPIKIGDRVVVDTVDGVVSEIGVRSTKVLSNDNITIIVPNTKFITENVINWQYNDPTVRFRIPVGVAYGTDVRLVEKVLLEVATAASDVLADPEPAVRFMGFGDNSLDFELRAWSSSLVHRKGKLMSDLNFEIYAKFNEHKIEFPFPQRDLHVRSGSLDVRLQRGVRVE
ncbi:MAG: mechanosensitive ion channel domain-containing protein, partial [Betaproteobacteria bacterium]